MKSILQMIDITKSYSGVEVLHSVDFELFEGEVHALIGENGAGKSTLMKILMGACPSDSGSIYLDEKLIKIHSPKDSAMLGITMVQQELYPILDMTVADNIFVGNEITKYGIVCNSEQNKLAKKFLVSLGITFSPTKLMKDLSIAEMQMVEIAKNISFGARMVIMDEPTSAITGTEVDRLFDAIRLLKRNKISVVYISHRLEELFEISDSITILRDGNKISTLPTKGTTKEELISLMVGRDINEIYPPSRNTPKEICLSVKGLTRKGEFQNISFDLRKGERLGIAGLVGAGRSELVQTIFGERVAQHGSIVVNGKEASIKRPGDAITLKIALITEDRKKFGLNLIGNVQDNLTSIIEKELCTFGFFNAWKSQKLSEEMVDKLNIKVNSIKQLAGSLSGGNQQKVVLGKWLLSDIDIYIFDEPTRGIDIGAKNEIYKLINLLAEEDKGIIIISSEMPELIGLSDRIIVLHEGNYEGELVGDAIMQENIMRLASGI